MVDFICDACGANLQAKPGISVCKCEYCGTLQEVPLVDIMPDDGDSANNQAEGKSVSISGKIIKFIIPAGIAVAIAVGIISYKSYQSNDSSDAIAQADMVEETEEATSSEMTSIQKEYASKNATEIYAEAINQMKDGSIEVAYSLLQLLPEDYKDSSHLKEMVEFYLPYNRTYRMSYGVKAVKIKINIDPETERARIYSPNQVFLDKSVPYKTTFVSRETSDYKVTFNLKTGEFYLMINGRKSSSSGTYNH